MNEQCVVVIGSGPAGAIAAAYLGNAGLDVVLLEAGSRRAALGLTATLGGITCARIRTPLFERRHGVRMCGDRAAALYECVAPGGLTNHWSMAVPRFSPDDFADAERAGPAYEWPLAYADLAPWYDRVEPHLCIAGASRDRLGLPGARVLHERVLDECWNRTAREAERDGRSFGPLPYAFGGATTLTLSGTAFNSYVRLIQPAMKAGRVKVRFDARVHWIQWSPAKRRVTGVVYRDARTGKEERIFCRALVVAAGAINTAKLLLQSTSSDFPHGLGNTDGVLGRYLHDHPIAKLKIDVSSPTSARPAAYLTRAALARSEPLYAAAACQWTGPRVLARLFKSRLLGHPPEIGFNVFGAMAPVAEGRVTLDDSVRCLDGTPSLAIHIRHPPESSALMESSRQQILDLLERGGMRPKQRLWVVERAGSSIHFGGTCRMHAQPKFGMLDGWGRMHAVRNVVVADSASFTTGPEKNPALTAMALAARASDKLARDLRAGEI